jgi:hypothetical protein
MKEGHVGHERLLGIEQFTLPLGSIKPRKLPIDPDPGVGDREGNFLLDIGDIDSSVQFLTDMRPVNITEMVVPVKIQQQFSIPEWQVSWHSGFLLTHAK